MPTEKEKTLAGQVYNPGQDEELVTELTACKAKCLRYNQLPSGAKKIGQGLEERNADRKRKNAGWSGL